MNPHDLIILQLPISQQTANSKLNPMMKISNLKYKIKENIY